MRVNEGYQLGNLQPSDVKNASNLATQVQRGNALESANVASY
jgi:hypothetical protein